jgi:hypothetical protein
MNKFNSVSKTTQNKKVIEHMNNSTSTTTDVCNAVYSSSSTCLPGTNGAFVNYPNSSATVLNANSICANTGNVPTFNSYKTTTTAGGTTTTFAQYKC